MSSRFTRRAWLGAIGVGTAALAGCTGSPGGGSGGTGTADTEAATTTGGGADDETEGSSGTEGTETETNTGTLPPLADTTLPLPLSPEEIRNQKVVSGGVPKDGIPSIDSPSFTDTKNPGWLSDDAIVFGVVRGGEVKAYPRRILAQHEIVNDTIGGDNVAVTYCPLTGTALGFDRGDTTFGVSGRLVNNNLIMYDRATGNWWSQVLATGLPGFDGASEGVGKALRQFRVVWTTWGAWKERYPETTLLSRDTGFVRSYDRDPYGQYLPERGGYYDPESSPMFPALNPDDSYPAKQVFMSARTGDGAMAVRKSTLAEQGVMTGQLGDTEHLAVYDPGLGTGHLYRNPDGLAFEWQDGQVAGPDGTHAPDSLPLEAVRVPWFDAMWFAYSGFYPEGTAYA